MKRMISISAVLLMVALAVSCASTKEATQEDMNEAFDKVYDKYRSSLILDGAATHTVVSGDTLSKIAQTYYGAEKGYHFPVIMLASSEIVLDPDMIRPGMELTVPDLQKNLDDPLSRSNIKAYFKDVAKVYEMKGNATVQTRLVEISQSL
ncbi:MAG: LysM peptidoglycan-binding domain-containing protein [Spirochaetaceae bacterium]|jgi:hypothetical protein|nr:LysM peptidoglycan-binding domain-containing protein [Spirochaetaceae bacterium]